MRLLCRSLAIRNDRFFGVSDVSRIDERLPLVSLLLFLLEDGFVISRDESGRLLFGVTMYRQQIRSVLDLWASLHPSKLLDLSSRIYSDLWCYCFSHDPFPWELTRPEVPLLDPLGECGTLILCHGLFHLPSFHNLRQSIGLCDVVKIHDFPALISPLDSCTLREVVRSGSAETTAVCSAFLSVSKTRNRSIPAFYFGEHMEVFVGFSGEGAESSCWPAWSWNYRYWFGWVVSLKVPPTLARVNPFAHWERFTILVTDLVIR